jgi:ubiquinone/menaquinone biosynthesis C-methylase UbiE
MKTDHALTHRYESFGEQYARLGLTGTYYLAYRDVPQLISEFRIRIGDALDHGCGGGRGTRYLKNLGFKVVGVDRSNSMLEQARQSDPEGEYRIVPAETLEGIEGESRDLVFQSSVLEECSSTASMISTFNEFYRVLRPDGHVIIITASEELPKGDWVSFTYPTRSQVPRSGDHVRCVIRDSAIAFDDYYWTDQDYQSVFERCDFEVLSLHLPIGKYDEPYEWRDELTRPPWAIYILKKRMRFGPRLP